MQKKRKESRVNWHPITLQRSVILVWSYFLLCAANNEQHENHLKNDEEKKGKKEEETNHQPFPCGNLRKSRKDYQSKTDKISFSFWKTELVFCFTAYCDLQLQLHCTVEQVRTLKYLRNVHVRYAIFFKKSQIKISHFFLHRKNYFDWFSWKMSPCMKKKKWVIFICDFLKKKCGSHMYVYLVPWSRAYRQCSR